MEKRYRPLTEARKAAMKTLKRSNGKLEPEENSDDDMYTRDRKLKEGAAYDIFL